MLLFYQTHIIFVMNGGGRHDSSAHEDLSGGLPLRRHYERGAAAAHDAARRDPRHSGVGKLLRREAL